MFAFLTNTTTNISSIRMIYNERMKYIGHFVVFSFLCSRIQRYLWLWVQHNHLVKNFRGCQTTGKIAALSIHTIVVCSSIKLGFSYPVQVRKNKKSAFIKLNGVLQSSYLLRSLVLFDLIFYVPSTIFQL